MARQKTSESPRPTELQVIQLLTAAATGDTVYRDLYLQRATERLASLLSPAEYKQLSGQKATIENLLAQTRSAIDMQDWTRVQELTARAQGFRRLFEEKQRELALAKDIYEATDVAIDPFSPGFSALFESQGKKVAGLRDELLSTFASLTQADPAWSDLYAQRRTYFTNVSLAAETHTQQVAGDNASDLQQQMKQAAERGDLALVNRLAGEMRKSSTAGKSEQSPSAPPRAQTLRRSAASESLAKPFPPTATERAGALGLAAIELKPELPAVRQAVREFIDWYAWHPAFPVSELAKEGSIHLRPLLKEALKEIPEAKELTDPIVEAMAQFSINPYVNGGGGRYFPLVADSEWVLVEDFPEQEEAPSSPLLSALGFSQRRGLSRKEIETALRQHGGQVLQDRLGLDSREFRLVCIPFDVYLRVGRDRGWGQREQWTHFDGYQVMHGGRLRALVGGDVRYGGLLDLVSISPDDQRESVVTRFAIVRRERFMAR
jgi:hypothetical protein